MALKARDTTDDTVDLQKRGMRYEPFHGNANMAAGRQPVNFEVKEPMHGAEFFFSNCMVKVYQIPMLFAESSEFHEVDHQGTFIVQVYEKIIKKRQSKPKTHKRIKGIEICKKLNK